MALGIGVLTLAAMAGSTGATLAASVDAVPINDGNPTCGDILPNSHEIKMDPPGNGSESDGTVTVTVSDFQQSDAGNPGSFDWSADHPIAAVVVKAGSDKHNLYLYHPLSQMGDTNLGPQAGNGNGISHISFCYVDAPPPDDEPVPTPTPTPDAPEPTPTPEEPTPTPDAPEPTATPEPDQPTGGDDPEPTATPEPEGGVEPVTGTPGVTLPPTDTLAASATSVDADEGMPMGLILIGGLVAAIATLSLLLRPARERER
jgi:hypothetical protein